MAVSHNASTSASCASTEYAVAGGAVRRSVHTIAPAATPRGNIKVKVKGARGLKPPRYAHFSGWST
jgi:hypothetical protein